MSIGVLSSIPALIAALGALGSSATTQQKPPLDQDPAGACGPSKQHPTTSPQDSHTAWATDHKSPQELIVLLTAVEHRRRRGRECRLRFQSRGNAVEDSGDADRLGLGVLRALEQAGGEAAVDGLGLVGESRAVCGAAASDGQPAVSSGRIGEGQSRQMPQCHGQPWP